MDLDDLLLHYFGTADPATLTAAHYERGLEALRIGFGTEREPSRRFALWTLLDTLGEGPTPAEVFKKEPALRAAAERYRDAAFRLERFGEADES